MTRHELQLGGSVGMLAADGNRVAFSSCDSVGGLWQPGSRPQFFGGEPTSDACTNPPPSAFEFGGFESLAVAGDRVAYLLRGGGNLVLGYLFTASARHGYQPHEVAAFSHFPAGDRLGDETWGDLVGGGNAIAYATWSFSANTVSSERVSLVDDSCDAAATNPCPLIASSAAALVPLAAERGRLLLRRADGLLELRSAAGTLLQTFRAAPALDAALAGRLLVVLVPGALRVIDTHTGRLLHRWPLRSVPLGGVCTGLPYLCPSSELQLAGAADGLAAYVADGNVHVVRLADGLDAIIARARQAQITSAGLFYSSEGRGPWPGRVHFVPRGRLFGAELVPGSPPPQQSDLFAQTKLQLMGPFPGGQAGASIAAAGDVNGDGRADVIVGAPGASPKGRDHAGSAFVVFGRRKPGVIHLADLGRDGFEIDGSKRDAFVGGSVAALGDLNGDRLADVAVAENSFDVARVVVVLGSRHPPSIDLASAAPGMFSITGESAETGGAQVAAAGDVNGDHLADILVCCTRTGASAVVFGTRAPQDVDLNNLGDRGFIINGAYALTGVGDMNGDGLADIALASRSGSPIWVVYGKRDSSAVDVDSLGTGGFAITGHDLVPLAAVHDVNGDGLADLAVGSYAGSQHVAVVLGSRDPHPVDADALGAGGFTIENAHGPIGPAGDLNRDGLADLTVGTDTGTAIVYGQRSRRPVDVNTHHFHGFTITGATGPVTGVGDVVGAARSDLLIASPGASNNGPYTGTLYVFGRDTRAPTLRAHATVRAERVSMSVMCSEPCTVSATAGTASTPRVYLAQPGQGRVLRLDSTARVVTVRAVDDAGNITSKRIRTRP